MEDAGATLTVKFDYTRPLELSELSSSLSAIASHHARVAAALGADINDDRVKLYIRDVRKASVEFDLVSMAATYGTIKILQEANTLIQFAKNLWAAIGFFKGSSKDAASPKPEDVKDMIRTIAPTANDTGANLILNVTGGTNVFTFNVTSQEAAAVTHRARNWLAVADQPISGVQRDRLFFWRQVRDAAIGKGDRGVIETISKKDVRTIFASDDIKQTMLGEPLFTKFYIVDVEVQTVDGVPQLYKILEVKRSEDREAS